MKRQSSEAARVSPHKRLSPRIPLRISGHCRIARSGRVVETPLDWNDVEEPGAAEAELQLSTPKDTGTPATISLKETIRLEDGWAISGESNKKEKAINESYDPMTVPLPRRNFHLRRFIPVKQIGLFVSGSGGGKSTFGLAMGCGIGSGVGFAGLGAFYPDEKVRETAVLYLDRENDTQAFQEIMRRHGYDRSPKNFHWVGGENLGEYQLGPMSGEIDIDGPAVVGFIERHRNAGRDVLIITTR